MPPLNSATSTVRRHSAKVLRALTTVSMRVDGLQNVEYSVKTSNLDEEKRKKFTNLLVEKLTGVLVESHHVSHYGGAEKVGSIEIAGKAISLASSLIPGAIAGNVISAFFAIASFAERNKEKKKQDNINSAAFVSKDEFTKDKNINDLGFLSLYVDNLTQEVTNRYVNQIDLIDGNSLEDFAEVLAERCADFMGRTNSEDREDNNLISKIVASTSLEGSYTRVFYDQSNNVIAFNNNRVLASDVLEHAILASPNGDFYQTEKLSGTQEGGVLKSPFGYIDVSDQEILLRREIAKGRDSIAEVPRTSVFSAQAINAEVAKKLTNGTSNSAEV